MVFDSSEPGHGEFTHELPLNTAFSKVPVGEGTVANDNLIA